ncbi:unnamed protein product [Sphagnum jensenii]|jgi:hypothetical protein|uniref:Uncharacterized protein n=1 Tax=Sphagnum jensenii TaxID=128206 RepID=A0ABP1A2I9_9BRYO
MEAASGGRNLKTGGDLGPGFFRDLMSLLVRKDGFGGLVETGGFLGEYADVMVHRKLSKDLRSVVDRRVLTPA